MKVILFQHVLICYIFNKFKFESMSRGKIVMACQYATNVKQCAYLCISMKIQRSNQGVHDA